MTTGVLLITNDGELTQRLSHPKFGVKKSYLATLNKPLHPEDLELIKNGITLEDGPIQVDSIAYEAKSEQYVVSLELHGGRNRIVRRIFEHLGYEVDRLDRLNYGGLTKKNLSRGDWRFLAKHEVENCGKPEVKQEISNANLRNRYMKHLLLFFFHHGNSSWTSECSK